MTSLPLWSLADPVTTVTKAADFRVSLEDMVSGTGRLTDGDFANYEADGTGFDTGDVLFGRLRPYLAKSWRADRPGTAGGDIIVMRPTSRVTSKFLGWVVQSEPFVRRASAETRGVKMPRTAWEYLAPVPVWTPSLEQQRRIADYLDAETAQIDDMMAELALVEREIQSRLGRQIEEYLQAERHMTLGRVVRSLNTGPFGTQVGLSDYVDGGIPLINPTHLRDGVIEPDYSVSVSEEKAAELARHALGPHDVVLARRGDLGRCATVQQHQAGYLCGTGSLRAIVDAMVAMPEFVALAIRGETARSFLKGYSVGSTMDNLNEGLAGRIPIPAISLPEQRRVVEAVAEAREETDAMLADIAHLKALLSERRSALITAVITGTKEIA